MLDIARRAMARAPEVRAAAAEASAAGLDASAAARNRLPELSLHSGVLVAPGYDPAITNLGEYDLKLIGTVNVADGGTRRREQLRARARAAGALEDLEAARREAGRRAAELAVELLRGADRSRRHQAAVQWTGRVLDAIRAATRSGARSPADLVRLELEQRAARADLDADRRDAAAGRRELALLIGASDSTPLPLRDLVADAPAPLAADSARLLAAADTSAEVRRAESEVALAELELGDARARRALQLDLTGDAGFAGSDLTRWGPPELAPRHGTLLDRLREEAGASLALELRRPLVVPGAAATVAAREAALEAARQRLARARQESRRAVLDLVGRWDYAARDLPLLLGSERQAEDHLLHAQSLYVAGALPLLDLLDARRTLGEAQDRTGQLLGELALARVEAEIWR